MNGEHAERKRGNVYGRRKGPKMSTHQEHLLETLLPKLTLHIQNGADPRSYFSPPPCGEVGERSDPGGGPLTIANTAPHPKFGKQISTSPQVGGEVDNVWLEVGFGAGEHLHWQAQQNPRTGLIGAEPFVNGVAKLLSKFEGAPPHNIRLHMGDAREIIDALPDASLGRVFILFPDPWPKTRHHKRRFIQTEMLDSLARVMKPGAELRFGSDDAPLVEYTLERLMAHPAFSWTATRAIHWHSRPADWPPTRYEAKQLHGVPAFLRFRRI
ncbi:MAG TPA: tRNA (guanosine(46)-N7)-methyltransferase TrmB [Rhizomicrobium sp.]